MAFPQLASRRSRSLEREPGVAPPRWTACSGVRRSRKTCSTDRNALYASCFRADDIAYLRSLNMFPESLFDALPDFRFAGDVFAVAEGTPIFANEPLLEVTAPIGQAQVVETLIVNQISLQTVLASKAARVVAAAAGRPVVDFGARRPQGLDAALKGARAFAIAGVAGTSLLAAVGTASCRPSTTNARPSRPSPRFPASRERRDNALPAKAEL